MKRSGQPAPRALARTIQQGGARARTRAAADAGPSGPLRGQPAPVADVLVRHQHAPLRLATRQAPELRGGEPDAHVPELREDTAVDREQGRERLGTLHLRQRYAPGCCRVPRNLSRLCCPPMYSMLGRSERDGFSLYKSGVVTNAILVYKSRIRRTSIHQNASGLVPWFCIIQSGSEYWLEEPGLPESNSLLS